MLPSKEKSFGIRGPTSPVSSQIGVFYAFPITVVFAKMEGKIYKYGDESIWWIMIPNMKRLHVCELQLSNQCTSFLLQN